jgi:xylulokinase
LSGRPVLVVELSELVAYGAAVQAAALLSGAPLAEVASRWGARRGLMLEPVARDDDALARIAAWRQSYLATL